MKYGKMIKRQEKIIRDYMESQKGSGKLFYVWDDLPQDLTERLEKIKYTETLWMDTERLMGDILSEQRRVSYV